MSDTPLLQVQNVTMRFGGLVANSDVTISAGRGEILGLIGPNGAGKSTLFNIIAGAYPPSEGRVIFDGADITRLDGPARCRRGIARTFQVPKSFESMTVFDNVMVGALARGPHMATARKQAARVIEFAGLGSRLDAPAGELTPPERRRLEVARALATGPKLLLLDEVLTGLTPSEAALGVDLIRQVRSQGVTIIMVEHVMQVVMPLVDRAVVLDLGRLLSEGKPADIVRDPKVIKAYLGERTRAA